MSDQHLDEKIRIMRDARAGRLKESDRLETLKLAYSIPNCAKAVDLSVEKIRQHIKRGELIPSYVDNKPLIMHEEILRWLRSRSAERPES